MQKESYAKPDVKTVLLEPEALCNNEGSSGPNGPGLSLTGGGYGGFGVIGGLNGHGGSTGEGPSAGIGGSGTH